MLTEKQAISRLKRLAREWPDTLWLWCADSRLYVMPNDPTGGGHSVAMQERDEDELADGAVDQSKVIETIDTPSDGGDW